MAVLQTGQSFASGDQVTAQKLQDIANLATFRTGANNTADGSTIEVDANGGYLKVKQTGITSNELAANSVITAKIQDGAVTAAKLDSAAVSVLMPTSTILPYAGISLPGNPGDWLYCDGSEYDREITPGVSTPLFAALGLTYGVGNGSTTFNIPDLRGRVIAGQDDMGGSSANRLTGQSGGVDGDGLGNTGGSETHQLTEGELASHNHGYSRASGIGADGTGGAGYITLGSATTSSSGGNQAHNNVQPTIILNYIIKT
jgi:microcystin-dependent protein